MNERIKELYDQAHERKPVMVVDPATGNVIQAGYVGKPMFHQVFDPKKFTELIVKECIDTVLDCTVEYSTRPQIAQELKEHFGVEE